MFGKCTYNFSFLVLNKVFKHKYTHIHTYDTSTPTHPIPPPHIIINTDDTSAPTYETSPIPPSHITIHTPIKRFFKSSFHSSVDLIFLPKYFMTLKLQAPFLQLSLHVKNTASPHLESWERLLVVVTNKMEFDPYFCTNGYCSQIVYMEGEYPLEY